jgi:hypothetical protein
MVPIPPKSKNPNFWQYQLIGWLVFYAADLFLIFTIRDVSSMGLLREALDTPAGFFLTLALRQIYKKMKYHDLPVLAIIARISFWSILTTCVWYCFIYTSTYFLQDPSYASHFLKPETAIRWISYLAPLIFGWSVLYFGIKFWLNWDVEKERAEQAGILAQRAQLQMLRYQLNPHFLFNSLNSLRALVDEDRNGAKSLITELSEFLRYSLISRNHINILLKDELDAMRHYLSIEKKRYEDKLDVTFDVEKSAEQYPVLSFLIHPLVENAIKYGMQTSPMPLKIIVKAVACNGTLRLSVINSGRWLEPAPSTSPGASPTGLENVRARLQNAFPGRFALCTSEASGFVYVTVELQKDAVQGSEKPC